MDNSQTNEDFTICVVIPAYNIADYIARAIDSVLAQTRQADQIIVVNDGSTDNTGEIIKGYGDKITYIHQENAGLAAACNTGIKNTDCDWIALLDGDDEWLGDNLKLHVELLKRCPDLAWSSGNYRDYLYSDHRQNTHIPPQTLTKLMHCKDYFDDYFEAFTLGAGGHPNTMFIKRSALEKVGLFQHGLAFAEDIEMWFRMAMTFPKIGFVTEPIAVYYLDRPGSLSDHTTSDKRTAAIVDMLQKNIELSKNLGCFDRFRPCARYYLKRLIRSWLFQKDLATTIRGAISQFDDVLSVPYKTLVKALTVCPGLTSTILHGISKVVRSLNLRKMVVKRPKKND